MKWIPVCVSVFFFQIVDFVKPFFIRANTFIRSVSGMFSNKTIIPGYMEHDPKKEALKRHRS
jgi:hypothetical protein